MLIPQILDPSRLRFTNTGVRLLRNGLLRSEMHGLSSQLQRAIDLNSEPGASSWLLASPLQDLGYHLTKQEFWDALHLRYGWTLLNTPSHCVCGSPFTADHAMICRHGGLTFVRHNEIRLGNPKAAAHVTVDLQCWSL